MAAPTLETDAGATILRITAGTSGNPVTWNDVWDWDDGGGSSGGDGDVPKDGGGTAKVNTFMTEIITDRIYTIEKHVYFGNPVEDASYFQSKYEMVYFANDKDFFIRGNATLKLGELVGSWGTQGSTWSFAISANFINVCNGGTLYLYASVFHCRSARVVQFGSGNVVIKNSILSTETTGGNARFNFTSGLSSLYIDKTYFNTLQHVAFRLIPDSITDMHTHNTENGIRIDATDNVVLTGVLFTSTSNVDVYIWTSPNVFIKDPKTSIASVEIATAGNKLTEQYTCNIHVTDKDGVDLIGVNIECIETGGAQVFSVNTDAAGDIVEQTVDYKQWAGTLETLTDYSPHQFILTKAGYKPLYLDEITVDHPLVWELEMPEAVGAFAGAWK